MSDEHDSWLKDAFGLDLGASLGSIKDDAAAALGQAASAVTQTVQSVQGAVEGALDGVTGVAAGVVKKVAGAVSPSRTAGAGGNAGGGIDRDKSRVISGVGGDPAIRQGLLGSHAIGHDVTTIAHPFRTSTEISARGDLLETGAVGVDDIDVG